MPKYKCTNPKCSKFNKIEGRNSKGFYDKIQQKVIDTGAICPKCKNECELQLPSEFSRNLINRP
jgi:hypothetical protein